MRAMKELAGVHLLFLGADDARYSQHLGRVAATVGVGDRVHLSCSVPVPDVLAYARQANVGVSLLEDTCENHRLALPNKVFEYVAAGLPVVVSRLPELERLVNEHRIGWTADPSDPGAVGSVLAEALMADGKAPGSNGDQARPAWTSERERLVSVYDN